MKLRTSRDRLAGKLLLGRDVHPICRIRLNTLDNSCRGCTAVLRLRHATYPSGRMSTAPSGSTPKMCNHDDSSSTRSPARPTWYARRILRDMPIYLAAAYQGSPFSPASSNMKGLQQVRRGYPLSVLEKPKMGCTVSRPCRWSVLGAPDKVIRAIPRHSNVNVTGNLEPCCDFLGGMMSSG